MLVLQQWQECECNCNYSGQVWTRILTGEIITVYPASSNPSGNWKKVRAEPEFELTKFPRENIYTNGIFQKVRAIPNFELSVFELNGMHCSALYHLGISLDQSLLITVPVGVRFPIQFPNF